MRLVHQPEDDVGTGLEVLRKLGPEIGESRIGRLRAADQCTEAVTVVVRLDFDLQALAGRIIHHVRETAEFRGIERSELGALHALPQKWEPDHAQAFGRVVIDLGVRGVSVVGSKNARHIGAEFSSGEIYSEKQRACH
jgi:hypothetical protein